LHLGTILSLWLAYSKPPLNFHIIDYCQISKIYIPGALAKACLSLLLAPTACANSSTILLFPVPEIPERITKGLVFKLRYKLVINSFV
jgi:hypothetical protein